MAAEDLRLPMRVDPALRAVAEALARTTRQMHVAAGDVARSAGRALAGVAGGGASPGVMAGAASISRAPSFAYQMAAGAGAMPPGGHAAGMDTKGKVTFNFAGKNQGIFQYPV